MFKFVPCTPSHHILLFFSLIHTEFSSTYSILHCLSRSLMVSRCPICQKMLMNGWFNSVPLVAFEAQLPHLQAMQSCLQALAISWCAVWLRMNHMGWTGTDLQCSNNEQGNRGTPSLSLPLHLFFRRSDSDPLVSNFSDSSLLADLLASKIGSV